MGWGRTSAAHPQEKSSRLTGVKQCAESRLWGAKFCYCGRLAGLSQITDLAAFSSQNPRSFRGLFSYPRGRLRLKFGGL